MITSTSKKTGRPKALFKDRHGNQIEGLMRLKDGRWRVSGPEKYTFSERDEDLAVARFRAYEAKRKGMDPPMVEVGNAIGHDALETVLPKTRKARVQIRVPADWRKGITISHSLDTAETWAWVREQILTRPQYVAQRIGIEQIGYLADIPKPVPSPTLVDVGELYLNKPRITPNWKAKAKGFWREFVECVGVAKLRDITQEHVVEYHDMILDAAESPTYTRQRFGAIKTIINYPTKRGKWAEDCKRALAFCSVLVQPQRSATDPQPIEPDAFRTLYGAASDQMKAILLLALNACMYAGEVAALDWDELDLDKGTLVTARNKTKVVRVATLWDETVAALRQLPRRGEHLFVTEAGTQADYLCVYRMFKAVRKAADLEYIQFAQLRDGAYTAAVEAGIDLNTCRLLAGHQTGISDHYVKRRPTMVAAACDAVRNAYAPFTGS